MRKAITIRANGTRRVALIHEGESKVEQSHGKECNINTIMAKYTRTGLLPQCGQQPMYGDFTSISDYHACQNSLAEAELEFLRLPSELRARFNNSAGVLIDYLNDPENEQEAQELGLLATPEAVQEPEKDVAGEPDVAPEANPEAAPPKEGAAGTQMISSTTSV